MAERLIISSIMREHGETGVQTHVNEFMKFLNGEKKQVQFVNPFSYNSLAVIPIFAARTIIDLLSGPLSVWWYRFFHCFFLRLALAGVLGDGRAATIYAQCPLSAKAAMRARRSQAQKVVMVVHYSESQAEEWVVKGKIKRASRIYRGIRKLESEVLPALDGLVFVSRYVRAVVWRDIPATKSVKSVVLPNFVARPTISGEHEIMGDLISVGSLEVGKNHKYILRALFEARSLGHEYSLTIIGGGPMYKNLRALTTELGLERQVTFLGHQIGAAANISRHRALVHSALMESFGLVLVEAMARGVPVIAAPVGGIPEVFSDGVEGLYWPLDDPRQGAKKIIDLLENRDLYERTSRAAKKRYDTCYESGMVAAQLADFLEGVGHRRRCRSHVSSQDRSGIQADRR